MYTHGHEVGAYPILQAGHLLPVKQPSLTSERANAP